MDDLALGLNVVLAAIVTALFGFAAAGFHALVTGCLELRRERRANSQEFGGILLKSPIVPGVSVLYSPPAADLKTRATVRRLLDLHFAQSELVLVLDGPSQVDLNRWVEDLRLVPLDRSGNDPLATQKVRGCYVSRDPLRLLVVDKERGGQADALNAAVNAARYPVLALVDAEADFIPGFLLSLIRPMLQDWERTMGVCGVAPSPAGRGLAGQIGALETLRMYLARCAAFGAWNRVAPVPGCCMLVKRAAVLANGGFSGEPLELFLDLHTAARAQSSPYRIAFVPTGVSCRPAANSWEEVRRDVLRDQHMLTTALHRHGPGAGREFLGLFCFRVLRPLLETGGLLLAAVGLGAGLVPPALAALVLLAGAGSGMVTSMAAVVLHEIAQPGGMPPLSLATLFFAAVPENLGYRQLRNLWLLSAFFKTESRTNGPGPRARDESS